MNRNILWAERIETRARAAAAPRPLNTTTIFLYNSLLFSERIYNLRPLNTTSSFTTEFGLPPIHSDIFLYYFLKRFFLTSSTIHEQGCWTLLVLLVLFGRKILTRLSYLLDLTGFSERPY
jgi:hypothetical protein